MYFVLFAVSAGRGGRGQTCNLFCQTANCRIYIWKCTRNGLVALPAKESNIKAVRGEYVSRLESSTCLLATPFRLLLLLLLLLLLHT